MLTKPNSIKSLINFLIMSGQSNELNFIQETLRQLELTMANQKEAPKSLEEAQDKDYKFWKTQPVPQIGEVVASVGPVEPNTVHKVDPYLLPKSFEWDTLNLCRDEDMHALYDLLNLNYVENAESTFRFDYSKEFLNWALNPPGTRGSWHCAVRVSETKKLVAFISAIPAKLSISSLNAIDSNNNKTSSELPLVEINFLCIHKKLRSKRLSPILIKEITRRVHSENLFQATYTAGVYLPTPICTARYWHRSIQFKKLLDIGFSYIPHNSTMQKQLKRYALPETYTSRQFRLMTTNDHHSAHQLLLKKLLTYKIAPTYTFGEFVHWFNVVPGVIYSFVSTSVTDPNIVTGFISYYVLNSSVLGNEHHTLLNVGYLFYYAEDKSDKAHLPMLVENMCIHAKNNNIDVINALNIMENNSFFEAQQFAIGDGNLHYYLYNYTHPEIAPEELGLILL